MEYAKITLESLLYNLAWPWDRLHIHIASDGDDEDYLAELRSVIDGPPDHEREFAGLSVSNTGGHSYGKNMNLATQVVHTIPGVKWVLPLEDDWRLVRTFDPSPVLDALDGAGFGCVRLGYVGYTQQLKGWFVSHGGYHWLQLDPDSAEPHVFAGHPRIESVEWGRYVGAWPEGLEPGATEWEVAHRSRARRDVAWPIDLVKPSGDLFAHIGTERSY